MAFSKKERTHTIVLNKKAPDGAFLSGCKLFAAFVGDQTKDAADERTIGADRAEDDRENVQRIGFLRLGEEADDAADQAEDGQDHEDDANRLKDQLDHGDLLIDTAGRLHNRIDLMNELTKIRNVMRKVIPDAPHEVLLVLDASTGQNAYQQAKEFSRATDITSLAITKLDGTAKGGVVIGIVDQLKVPVKFIGIGEGIDDLKVFDKKEFVNSLFSKEDIDK